ncbi:FecR family protein [Ohtaekwangia sp.]|uniref:FecR family protein n=1 Tax=Ohtaekwangia sp. TaxID=2066019 RepID=UPI002FDE0710
MNQEQIAQLLEKLRAGTATSYEKALLEEFWEKASADSSFTDSLSSKEKQTIKEELFANIKSQLQWQEKKSVRSLYPSLLYKVAASISIIVIVSFLWLYHSNTIEYKTGFGEKLTVVLPDRSTVILNGNSCVRYAKGWNEENTREVWIEGEGFFSVQHTKNHQKFIVHAARQLNVEVLGTKFNVKARSQKIEVMLAEGKVKLDLADKTNAHASYYLHPGELATVHNDSFSMRPVQQANHIAWLKNKLLFDETSLGDIAEILEEAYGLHIAFQQEELKNRKLSGEISSATAEDILKAISETFNLTVTRNGQNVTLSQQNETL